MTDPSENRERRLSATFVALADSLVRGYDVVELLQQLADTCVDLLDFDAAGLVLAESDGHLRVMASSSEQMRLLELLEIQNSDGPCLECFERGEAVESVSLAHTDHRWPRFAPAARAAGFTSAQALPLRLRDRTIGALNLLSARERIVGTADLALAQALADVATIAILQERALRETAVLAAQLQRALTNRLVIEQAKGVLAERGGLDIDAAFGALRGYCRDNRIAISDVAAQLTTGLLSPGDVLAWRQRGG